MAPDQIFSPPRGFSVVTVLPRAAFVCSGTIPRTDFSGADSGSEPPSIPPRCATFMSWLGGVPSKAQERRSS